MDRTFRGWLLALLVVGGLGLSHASPVFGQEPAPPAEAGDVPRQLQAPEAPPPAPPPGSPVDFNLNLKPRTAGNYLWPLLDVVAINVTMWSLPWALGVEWAQVGPESWQHN